VTRLRVSPALVAALAVAVAGAVLLAALARDFWSGGGQSALGTKPVLVDASLSPATAHFGDQVTAVLDVLVNPALVDPRSVRLETRFSPYDVVEEHDERGTLGGAAHLHSTYLLACWSQACTTTGEQRSIRFPAGRIVLREQGRGTTAQPIKWPALLVSTRLTPDEVALQYPPFRTGLALTKPSYSISPDLLGSLLLAGSGLLLVVAVGLLAPQLRARVSVPFLARLSPLQRALALIRHAGRDGDEARRRKALERLARELRARGEGELAHDAGRLAWSDDAPSPDSIEALAAQVERRVNGG
jgi:hypothetical protein